MNRPAPDGDGRLESWKEIAAYLNRTVRTVQRWEKLEGLPVRRLEHSKQASVRAYRTELDAWVAAHQTGFQPIPPQKSPARRQWWTVFGITAVVVTGAAMWVIHGRLQSSRPLERITVEPLAATIIESCPAISSEGDHVVQTTEGGGLQLVRAGKATVVQLLPASGLKQMGTTFSPDTRFVYFVAVRPGEAAAALYRIAISGGRPERLKEKIDSPVSFSPDGEHFVFAREQAGGDSTIIVAETGTGKERTIASRHAPEYLDYPSWSPDGRVIACTLVNQKAVESTLLVMSADGGIQRRLARMSWGFQRKAQWLPDGSGLLTSARDRAPGGYQIWHISSPGGAVKRLTTDLDDYLDVSVSRRARVAVLQQAKVLSSLWVAPLEGAAEGRQISELKRGKADVAWMNNGGILLSPSGSNENGIWVLRPDGSASRKIIEEGQFPASCGDGRIVFRLGRARGADGWIADRNGLHPRLLFEHAGDSAPACSPDGKWVAYTTADPGGRSTLWRISTSGGAPKQLSRAYLRSPAISPDGTKIAAFYTSTTSSSQTSVNQLAVFSEAGGAPLHTFPLSFDVDYANGLRWSPDGRGMAYVKEERGIGNIWIQLIEGHVRRLTNFQRDRIRSFDWSPDGRELVLSRSSETQELLLMRW